MIPLAILAFGIDFKMKVLVAFTAAVFPVLLSAYTGVVGISRTMRETAATYRLSAWSPAWRSRLSSPSCPMIAGNNGIGFFIITSQQTFQIPLIYVGIFTLGVVTSSPRLCIQQELAHS